MRSSDVAAVHGEACALRSLGASLWGQGAGRERRSGLAAPALSSSRSAGGLSAKSASPKRPPPVAIRRFKRIEQIEIPLGDVTLLIGANNSGKSSILQAIHFAVSIAQTARLIGESRSDGAKSQRNSDR
jgi:hypothetical protein